MELLIFGAFVVGLYGCLWFFDSFFKSCMHYPYQAFLHNTGLTVRPFRLHWQTVALNRTIVKWSSKYPRALNASFDVGIWTALVLLPCSALIYLVWMLCGRQPLPDGTAAPSSVGLELMLPGVNLPLDEIGYYCAALAVCTVVHELGHAAAAVLVDVPVTAFGLHLLLVFPLAYTELATEKLQMLRLRHRLSVLCAGVWHNVLLAAVGWSLLLAMHLLWQPWFALGSGVYVTHVQRASPVRGARGLAVGDVVTAINGCPVTDLDDWFRCLLRTIREPPAYCISSDFVRTHDESVPIDVAHQDQRTPGGQPLACCDPANARMVCFEYAADGGADEAPFDNVLAEIPQHTCLEARATIENSMGFCDRTRGTGCTGSFCMRPSLDNGTTIVQLRRRSGPGPAVAIALADVMYIGHPADITRSVRVSEHVPKTQWLSARWADGWARLLRYVVVFSLGLAVMNMLPCYAFDGQHIVAALVQHLVADRRRRELIAFGVTGAGTLLFAAGLVRVAYASVSRYLLWT